MRPLTIIFIEAVILGGLGYLFLYQPPTFQGTAPISHVQLPISATLPPGLYPDKALTPGKAATLKLADLTKRYNGLTYSQAHRNVPQSEKRQIYAEYDQIYPGLTEYCIAAPGRCEVDHFYPECAGGSNDPQNLWIEPAQVPYLGKDYGFHQKDELETYICAQIKAGKLAPQEAFTKLTSNWVAYYQEVFEKD